MKRLLLASLLLVGVYVSQAQYLETTYTFFSANGTSCPDPSFPTLRKFDLEVINADNFLDMAMGEQVRSCAGGGTYYGAQIYNDGTGTMQQRSDFFSSSSSNNTNEFKRVLFGKLRTTVSWKDLAIARTAGTQIHFSTGNGIAASANQTVAAGVDATWGAFDNADDLHDLAVATGTQVKIYRNLGNGSVNTSPNNFSISATKIVLAQMDQNIYSPNGTNKWDLVSVNGSTLSRRLNNGANGFGSPQNINVGATINSFAVGDINNDNFNDVVVVTVASQAKLYLNNGSGTLNTTAAWTASFFHSPIVAIGEMGSPSDATRSDNFTDLVFLDGEAQIKVFINQCSSPWFTSSPQQSLGPWSPFDLGKHDLVVGDLQNSGGLSVVFSTINLHAVVKHVGNPAPAPPKNLTMSGTTPPEPILSWVANSERDLSSYEVWRSINTQGGPPGTFDKIATVSTNTYTDYGLAVGGSWMVYYKVKAVDTQLNASDFSNMLTITASGFFKSNEAHAHPLTPHRFELSDPYPNPFNPSTKVNFDLAEPGYVSLIVYDILGREVRELASGYHEPGYHSATWDRRGRRPNWQRRVLCAPYCD